VHYLSRLALIRHSDLAKRILDFSSTFLESQSVFTRFGHVLLIVALLAATGAHWTVLQSVAWTTMLADNLRKASLTEALERTFDGKHPCSLCKQITAGRKSEKKTEFPLQLKKLEFIHASACFTFAAPSHFWLAGAAIDSPQSLSHSPPVPPPRTLLG